ncbi:cohesin domain-containing protein [Paenibacillus sp. strain BS8-2]
MAVHERKTSRYLSASKLLAVCIAFTLLFGLIPPYSSVQAEPYIVNECHHMDDDWLFCDTFETNKLSEYYGFYARWGRFLHRTEGLYNSRALASYFGYYEGDKLEGQPYPIHGTKLKLAVGKTPDNAVYKPAGDPAIAERDLYWRFFLRNKTQEIGDSVIQYGPLARVYGYGAGDTPIMQIEIDHPNADGTLVSKLSTGQFDTSGQPTGTAMEAELTGTTPIMRADQAGAWRMIEIHAKLNDPGQTNGVYELWIDGELESSQEDIDWVGSYTDYGINAIEIYNNNNDPDGPVGSDNEFRVFDNLIVSRERIGDPQLDVQTNANLNNIGKSVGKLTPHFQPNVTSYTLTVPHGVTSAQLTPEAAVAEASVSVEGTVLAPGASVTLTDEVTIDVTAADGATTKSYTVTLVQADPILVNECQQLQADWLFCDDFEQDRSSQYFERTSQEQFYRTGSVGLGSSSGMKAEYRQADGDQHDTGAIKVAIGRTPHAYLNSVAAQNEDLREIYYRFYVKHEQDWTGGGGDKLARVTSLQNGNWAQAMTAVVWSGNNLSKNYLVSEAVSGIDEEGNLKSTGWNDFANNSYVGARQSTTPMYDENHAGSWYAVEARVKLNDPGQSNGIFEVWIDDKLEMSNTNLDWIGTYEIGPGAGYGLNWVSLENYWNAGTPQDQERYFDNFVISRSKIGLATQEAVPAEATGTLSIDSLDKQPGDTFELTVGASGVGSLNAADVIVNYDPDKVTFATVTNGAAVRLADSALESLVPDSAIASFVKENEGQIRLIVAKTGAPLAISEQTTLIRLNGQIKPSAAAGDTSISLTNFTTASNGISQTLNAANASVTASIIVIDSTALGDRIVEAEQIHSAAAVGTLPGQYPASAKTALNNAIESADQVYTNSAATQNEIDQALTALNAAIAAFEASVIVALPANFAELEASITAAEARLSATFAGTKLGQYPSGARTALTNAVGAAEAVLGNTAATQAQVDQAADTLDQAVMDYNATIITLVPGATGVSIADLSIVANYFGVTSQDPQWSDIAAADIKNQGEITIEAIAAIAQMILNDWAGIPNLPSQPNESETSGVIVDYNFAAGDNWVDKDGWDWKDGIRDVELVSGVSERGAKYHYAGGNNPFGDGTLGAEQYFSMPELSEFWLKRRIWIPENYFHRKTMRLTLSDATGWEVGDLVQGANANAQGIIQYMDGNRIALQDTTYPEYNNMWNTTVTNVTKGLTAVGSGRSQQSTNNKFQVFYSDGYSFNGQSPTAVFQLWPNDYPGNIGGNGSNLQLQVAVDGAGSGQKPNTNMGTVPFLDGDDVGMWIDVVFYMKMSSSPTVYDGTAIVWLRKEGETGYTKKLDQRALNMGARPGAGSFRNGYMWGWANSGYEEPTTFYESRVILSEESIDGLVP